MCISILHSAGDDPHGYESAAERWSPVQSVSTIAALSTNCCVLAWYWKSVSEADLTAFL